LPGGIEAGHPVRYACIVNPLAILCATTEATPTKKAGAPSVFDLAFGEIHCFATPSLPPSATPIIPQSGARYNGHTEAG
jgi:hypothetical protein